VACAVAVAALWRCKVSFEIKAAGLATAIPLASAYIQAYDLTLLTVALSFLYRHRSFDRRDWAAVSCAVLSFGTFWWERAHPAALIACTAVGAIILLRLLRTDREVSREGATGVSRLSCEPGCLLPQVGLVTE
jgi:hypothetical protein